MLWPNALTRGCGQGLTLKSTVLASLSTRSCIAANDESHVVMSASSRTQRLVTCELLRPHKITPVGVG